MASHARGARRVPSARRVCSFEKPASLSAQVEAWSRIQEKKTAVFCVDRVTFTPVIRWLRPLLMILNHLDNRFSFLAPATYLLRLGQIP